MRDPESRQTPQISPTRDTPPLGNESTVLGIHVGRLARGLSRRGWGKRRICWSGKDRLKRSGLCLRRTKNGEIPCHAVSTGALQSNDKLALLTFAIRAICR